MEGHQLVFLAGLHRSGTTLLARLLAAHPEISGFSETGVPADEGQHLQSVYPLAQVYGGPGRFGFAPESHLTERSPLASQESARKLFEDWSPHWFTNSCSPTIVPRRGFVSDGHASTTRLRAVSTSPGRTGASQRSSSTPGEPMLALCRS